MHALILAFLIGQAPAAPAPPDGQGQPGPHAAALDLLGLLDPVVKLPDEATLAGLPDGTKPLSLTWDRVYAIASQRPPAGVLEPATLDALVARTRADDFARFREYWLNSGKPGADRDPAPEMLDALARRVRLEAAWWRWSALAQIRSTFSNLISGESAGITQFQLDQVAMEVTDALSARQHAEADYRDALDRLKAALGLAPGTPVVPDPGILEAHAAVFDQLDRWQRDPKRTYEPLPVVAGRLPALGPLVLRGRELSPMLTAEPGDWERELGALAAQVGDRRAEWDLRTRLRHIARIAKDDRNGRSRLILGVRAKSSAFEQILGPPVDTTGAQVGGDYERFLRAQVAKVDCNERLALGWIEYQGQRLAIQRAAGEFPYKNFNEYVASLKAQPGREPTRDEKAPAPAAPAPAPR